MKALNKILCIMIAVIILSSCFSLGCFAAGKDNGILELVVSVDGSRTDIIFGVAIGKNRKTNYIVTGYEKKFTKENVKLVDDKKDITVKEVVYDSESGLAVLILEKPTNDIKPVVVNKGDDKPSLVFRIVTDIVASSNKEECNPTKANNDYSVNKDSKLFITGRALLFDSEGRLCGVYTGCSDKTPSFSQSTTDKAEESSEPESEESTGKKIQPLRNDNSITGSTTSLAAVSFSRASLSASGDAVKSSTTLFAGMKHLDSSVFAEVDEKQYDYEDGSVSSWIRLLIAMCVIAVLVFIAIVLLVVLRNKKKTAVKSVNAVNTQVNQAVANNRIRTIQITRSKTRLLSQRVIVCGVSGCFTGKSFRLIDNLEFGIDPFRCSIAFPQDTSKIGGVHCVIGRSANGIYLKDNDSAYGTYLENGTRLIAGELVPLYSGMRFYIADRNNMFEIRM